ncbi:FkbM family methyltransferase [Xinfangfangia sp. D13-10-4-6]|uniref:FkbM family methyltransferase n=1 Tax=Pseudogemmobacter hezensis TaxID=2737662 RepID=UPI00155697C8|nr:FkbM family methyltransferase [Pseudogemmobacter hezensis]NPD16421.1 FkbM family methyltransferase [Pseudogemmobacter hezensis]
MAELRHFTIRGIRLSLPPEAFQGRLAQALETGRYENNEASALEKHLRPEDRFVDFGAGIGFLCALAARICGPQSVCGVEAGPETIDMARANLQQNGYGAAKLIHAAVTGDQVTDEAVDFGVRRNFWASGLRMGAAWGPNAQVVQVPALASAPLLQRLQPTVLSCDIEGAEIDALAAPMPASVRLIITEIHPAVYGPAGTKRLFDGLSNQGFAYEADGSRGATVVFRRLNAA